MEELIITEVTSNTNLILSENDYFVDSTKLEKEVYYISNNDVSEKSIAFNLKNKKNIELDFSNSNVVFNGRITPFVIDNCQDITIKNICINYDRPFFSQGEVVFSNDEKFILKFSNDFSFKVVDSELIFLAPNWEENINKGFYLFQQYDVKTKSVAYNANVELCVVGKYSTVQPNAPGKVRKLLAKDLGENCVEFSGDIWNLDVGNAVIITHEKRLNNIIFAKDSANLKFENITIVHSGSMGIICQCCENIFLDNITIALGDKSKGLITTNCDATHFVNCSGLIEIRNSVFENMLDDGVNIHGLYTEVAEKQSDNQLVVSLMHYQQYGVNVYKANDKIVAYAGKSVEVVGVFTVLESEFIDEKSILITFKECIKSISIGDHLENRERMPSVIIDNCITGKNRPRGFLISTPKSVKITNCKFNSAAYAIHIAGDTSYWFESGGVEDVIIENNTFLDCGYQMCDYAIGITPEYLATTKNPFFHKNIVIRNNFFRTFTDGIVYAMGVDTLVVSQNKYHQTNTYKKRIDTQIVNIVNCQNVTVE